MKEKLKNFLSLLKNPKLKSMQAAFNASFTDIRLAKEIFSWKAIVELVEMETAIKLDPKIASNMYGISKRKQPLINLKEDNIEIKTTIDTTSAADLDIKYDTYPPSYWHSIGVFSERLIDDLNQYGLTPEQVKNWNLPSDQTRRKKLTEYIHQQKNKVGKR